MTVLYSGFQVMLSARMSKQSVALKCLIGLGCTRQGQTVYIVTSPAAYILHIFFHGQLTCKAL